MPIFTAKRGLTTKRGVAVRRARALPLLIFLVLFVAAAPVRAADVDELRALALELVNRERRDRDLPPFERTSELDRAAQAHAEDMRRRDYYGHASPEGRTVMDRYVAAGGSRWRRVQENIARCGRCSPPPTRTQVETLHRGWMNSPSHRENILNPGVNRFGFGIAVADANGLYAVQTFAGPGSSPSADGSGSGEAAGPLAAEAQSRVAAGMINDARRDAGVEPVASSDVLADAARALARDAAGDDFGARVGGFGLDDLPEAGRRDWRGLSVVAGRCGGCGLRPTAADIGVFRDQWLQNPEHRAVLLDGGLGHFGFAIAADGKGGKTAIAIFGRRR